MAYSYITNRTSPNKWVGGNTIKSIVIHWWGDPKKNPTAEGVVNHLCNPATQVSAHFVITGTGRRVWHLVDNKDRAWHAMSANGHSLGLELDPRCRNSDYDVAAEVIAELWKAYGKLPLEPHSKYVNTACPGKYDLKRLAREAEKKLNPPKPKPQPKITYEKIAPKSIELIRDANLWNFNFTKWADAKSVQSRKKGAVIENIVAIATNPVGATYYMTDYSYNKGKIRATNGFNTKDAKDYVKPPVTPPKPEPTPEPTPELPIIEKPDYEELEARLTALEKLIKTITDFLDSLFKNWRK